MALIDKLQKHSVDLIQGLQAHATKKPESHTVFWVSGAHVNDYLSITLTVRSAQYVAGRGWFRRRSRPTWPRNPNNTGFIGEQAFVQYMAMKNQWKSRRSFQRTTLRRWVTFRFSLFFASTPFRGQLACMHSNDCSRLCENLTRVFLMPLYYGSYVKISHVRSVKSCIIKNHRNLSS